MLTYHSKFLLIAGGTFQREQRTVVTYLPFPLAMEIVCHYVDEVLKRKTESFESEQ